MRILWVGRAAGGEDGGAIYDTRMRAALSRTHDVRFVQAHARGRLVQLAEAASRLSAPETFGYGRSGDVAAIAAAAADVDAVIFSHEYLDRLAALVRQTLRGAGPPFISIRHNVTSDLMAQVFDGPAGDVYAAAARRAERAALAGDLFAGLVALSERDRALVTKIAGRDDVGLAMPGAPPPSPLAETAAPAPEALLLGTYDWMPKARDFSRFLREAVTAGPPAWSALFVDDVSAIPASLHARPATALDLASAIRFGLVTDRFAAGHKLKTAAYLTANCHVLTFADVAGDFGPLAQAWVHRVRSLQDVAAVIQARSAQPANEARAQLAAVKAEVCARLDWALQAAALAGVVERSVGAQRRR